MGLRIQLTLIEDGTDQPPELPPGTVVRRLIGPDRNDYFEVRLDRPVKCIRSTTGKPWILNDIAIVTRYEGDSLDSLRHSHRTEPIVVGVSNILKPIFRDEPMIDLDRVAYFAIAEVRVV